MLDLADVVRCWPWPWVWPSMWCRPFLSWEWWPCSGRRDLWQSQRLVSCCFSCFIMFLSFPIFHFFECFQVLRICSSQFCGVSGDMSWSKGNDHAPASLHQVLHGTSKRFVTRSKQSFFLKFRIVETKSNCDERPAARCRHVMCHASNSDGLHCEAKAVVWGLASCLGYSRTRKTPKDQRVLCSCESFMRQIAYDVNTCKGNILARKKAWTWDSLFMLITLDKY